MHSSYKCVKVQKVFTMSLLSWLKKSEIDKPETEAVELTDTAELTTSDPLLGKPVQPSYQNDQSTMPKHPHQPIITFPLRKFGRELNLIRISFSFSEHEGKMIQLFSNGFSDHKTNLPAQKFRMKY